MVITKGLDWEAPVSRLGLKGQMPIPRQPPKHRGLYRAPMLPVVVGTAPAGGVVSIQKWMDDTRDWRRLAAAEVARVFADLEAKSQIPTNRIYPVNLRRSPEERKQFDGLMAAVAVGTLQACSEGVYSAQSPEVATGSESRSVRSPITRAMSSAPDISRVRPKARELEQLTVSADVNPLEVCRGLIRDPKLLRVGLLRFVPIGDSSSMTPTLGDHRESQLLLRTSFLEAVQEMPRHLHADPAKLLDSGAVLCTTDITIMRGTLETGAPWLLEPACIEVFTVALPRHPRNDEHGQYARIVEKAQTAEAIDRAFACAVMQDIDALVLSPPGVGGVAGCHHPAMDAGDLLRKAILSHGHYIPRVWVVQDHVSHLKPAGCWAEFASAVEKGRPAMEHKPLVPLHASPYVRPGWAPLSMSGTLDSLRGVQHDRTQPGAKQCSTSQLGGGATGGPASFTPRSSTPLGSSRGASQDKAASLGAAGRVIAC